MPERESPLLVIIVVLLVGGGCVWLLDRYVSGFLAALLVLALVVWIVVLLYQWAKARGGAV